MNTARHAMEILPLVVIMMVLSMWSFPRNLECMLLTTWIDAQSHYSRSIVA